MFSQSLKLFRIAFRNESTCKTNFVIALTLELVSIALLYYLNQSIGSLYDGIQSYKADVIYKAMFLFAGLAGGLVLVQGWGGYFTNRLAFAIRTGLNTYFTTKFVNLASIDNIEQRIQEDLRNFGERSCEFWGAIISSLLKLPLFVGVVVSLTQWWVGLILILSVLLGTLATKVLAKKLIALQAEQESNEANYRKTVKNGVFAAFKHIQYSFNLINNQVKKLSFLQGGLSQTFVLLPFFILIPMYLSKKIAMGVLMQASRAMGEVIDSLTVLITQRQLIVNISTCLVRMETLDNVEVAEQTLAGVLELVRDPVTGKTYWRNKKVS